MESLRTQLFDIFERQWEVTTKSHLADCTDWTECYNHWIDLMKAILETVPREIALNSLTAFRFLEINRDILWSLFATMVGAYQSAIRELRFWLEAFLQAYLVDRRGGISRLSSKVEKLNGNRLIIQCGFGENQETYMKTLYADLCKYVHPTKRELNFENPDPRVTFSYDEASFDLVHRLHRSVFDAILFLVMSTFPDAATNYMSRPLVIDSLKKMRFDLSIAFLHEAQAGLGRASLPSP